MPTKTGENSDNAVELFLKIGLDEKVAHNTIANNKVTSNLLVVIHEAGVTDGCDRTTGNLLYMVATKFPANALVHRPTLCEYVVSSKVKTPAQLEAAFSFFMSVGPEKFSLSDFEKNCGVGIEVSNEEIENTVGEIFEELKTTILEQRYKTNVGDLFRRVRERQPWADPKIVKQVVDTKLRELLGERTAADDEKPVKKKKEKPAKAEEKAVVAAAAPPSEEELNPFSIFPSPEDNVKVHTEVFYSDGSVLRACNTKEILAKHLKVTGGKVLTRFPPEPNGYLHIGHAKAMFVDFGLAKDRGGHCYLRWTTFSLDTFVKISVWFIICYAAVIFNILLFCLYMDFIYFFGWQYLWYDDTNPEAEKKEYIDHIEEIVKWMGWEPFKKTYTSDYFQDLYELAVELIRRGHAYVDHQTADEVKEYREKKLNSPWRDRPVEESLKLFEEMRRGMIEEGKATLRMKQDMQNDNCNMYDLIAYRIKASAISFTPHPKAGDKWCIYPSYDFAHCVVDSLENLNCLVTEKYVDGWDDPRLMTLSGLRRRGVSPTAINAFVRGIGITRSDSSLIRLDRFEYHVREELNKTAARAMVVLYPLKVVITNLEAGKVIDLDAKRWPDAPSDDASALYKVPFSNVVYIEKSDFRMKDSKDYYGLAPGKSVLLRYAFPIKCTDVIVGDDNEIVEIRAEYDPEKKMKPKGVLHWVAEPSPDVEPLKVEVRLFDRLFSSENPAELDDWLGDLSPNSKVVIPKAYAVPPLRNAVLSDRFQFERLGYFAVDKDSTPEKLVFNRTVTLRDSYAKGGK
uniref:glutamine--tRNA ligase n=1 Tax=Chenopodium quinoa TaxID=63459 RepID=A0A803M5D2_CHEQI